MTELENTPPPQIRQTREPAYRTLSQLSLGPNVFVSSHGAFEKDAVHPFDIPHYIKPPSSRANSISSQTTLIDFDSYDEVSDELRTLNRRRSGPALGQEVPDLDTCDISTPKAINSALDKNFRSLYNKLSRRVVFEDEKAQRFAAQTTIRGMQKLGTEGVACRILCKDPSCGFTKLRVTKPFCETCKPDDASTSIQQIDQSLTVKLDWTRVRTRSGP